MIAVNNMPRVFKLLNSTKGSVLLLDDLSPDLDVNDIKDLYSAQYPELVNATVENPIIENDQLVYEFKTFAGTKG